MGIARARSFSLVELMAVLVIIGLLASVSVISISVIPSRQTQATARKVASDLCWVRELALTQDSDYCVRFSSDSDKFFSDVHKGLCTSADIIRHSYLRTPIVSPSGDFDIRFNTPDGGVAEGGTAYYDGSGTLEIDFSADEDTGWRVSVFEETGAVTLEQW